MITTLARVLVVALLCRGNERNKEATGGMKRNTGGKNEGREEERITQVEVQYIITGCIKNLLSLTSHMQ